MNQEKGKNQEGKDKNYTQYIVYKLIQEKISAIKYYIYLFLHLLVLIQMTYDESHYTIFL